MNLKYNVYLKIGAIVLITLLLLIPTAMIRGLISDREFTQQQAIREVSSKWSEAQTISGPFIAVPYHRYVKEKTAQNTEKTIRITEHLHLLPSRLNISGVLTPEKRHRSLYEIVVYDSEIAVSGNFDAIDATALDVSPELVQWDKAAFVVGVNDLRGIEKQIALQWNGNPVSFNPGVLSDDVVSSGINARISLEQPGQAHAFSFTLNLKGSQMLYFTPVGKTTDIEMRSAWNTPSFNGAFLPDSRSVSANGFSAKWNVLHLNRNYPQLWSGNQHEVGSSAFGIDLLLPVDNYQKTYRSIRYAILFIGFTFLTFFFIEVLNRVFIHPIQYILVGVALVVFYTLLLSLSEHMRFNLSFVVSALATLLLIGGYVGAILKSVRLTILITGILLVLYAFIFVVIQLEDYALLIGSIGIFIILGLVMYYSRKIDWYNLNLKAPQTEKSNTDNKPNSLQ